MSRPNFRTWQQRRFLFTLLLALSLVTVPFIPSSRASASLPLNASRVGQGADPVSSDQAAEATSRAQEAYGKLSLQFEANQGQTDRRVNFITRASGATIFLTNTNAVFVLSAPDESAARTAKRSPEGLSEPDSAPSPRRMLALRMNIEGANATPQVQGADELAGKVNYFVGKEPDKWRTDIPTFGRVQYAGVYPGVDLVYYSNQSQLEYDFVVKPGADASRIALNFEGADALAMDAGGDLLIKTSVGTLRQQKPAVYQEVNGERQEIESGYMLKGGGRIGFAVGAYDARRPLIIDPVLAYSTYLGGGSIDGGNGIAVDAAGNAYVTGSTASTDFPSTPGAFDTTDNANTEAFVTKLNTSGTALIYSTYLGGSSRENFVRGGVVVDSAGNAYVTGDTSSTDFPTTPGAFQGTNGGFEDAFVTKLNASGSALVYSTYLGGNDIDDGLGIAVDTSGNAYVTGLADSTNFPTANAFQGTKNVGDDAFVTKLNAAGSALVYSTYLGGGALDQSNGVAVDAAGNAYVTGQTASTDFPTTPGAFDTTDNPFSDAFVTKLNASGTALVHSTYLGGNSTDIGSGIAVDSAGNAYVTGFTASSDFPPTPGAFADKPGIDAFVTKLNASGTALAYSTYLGGDDDDGGRGIAVDSAGNAYVTGETFSTDFPTTPGSFDTTDPPGSDTFITKLNASGMVLVYSTYLGGNSDDSGRGIAVDSAGNAYVTGFTGSSDFPTTTDAFQTAGVSDAFVTKIGDYVIAGRVTDSSGAGIAGVIVTLSGASVATTQTDSSGNFNFLDTVAFHNYTVTPFKQGFTFSPSSVDINVLNTNQQLIFIGTTTGATPTPTPTPAQTRVHFEFDQYIAAEDCGGLSVAVVRSGDTTGALTVDFATSDGTANQKGDYGNTLGTLSFNPGETSKTVNLLITEDAFVEGDETFNVNLFNLSGPATLEEPSRASITIADDDTTQTNINPIDVSETFVCQHYHDFFNREPDTSGLLFWINNIESCGANASCREVKRIDTSAAFFLSIEFQGTGFYAIRLQRAAFGKRSDSASTRMTYQDLVRDTRQLGEGVIVGEPGAAAQLEQNKQNYAQQVVNSAAFIAHFPATLTAAEYVDALYASAQVTPSATERADAITAFGDGSVSVGRVAALRKIAESQSLINAEFSPAFVLLQYHGYLRRNPTDLPDTDDSGYQFWLTKLNSFGGDFRKAEMVKAFLSSAEYRQRFGQP
jgi:hypothetical protein